MKILNTKTDRFVTKMHTAPFGSLVQKEQADLEQTVCYSAASYGHITTLLEPNFPCLKQLQYRIHPIYRTMHLVFSKLQGKSDMKNRSKKRTPGTKK